MTYTEIKEKNGVKYYYRVRSVRKGGKVGKVRRYLGRDLSGEELATRENGADLELDVLGSLLTNEEREELEEILSRHSSQPDANRENRYESFAAAFTHDSTAIEGNTLTLRETASLLFDRTTPSAKELREIHEVLNHGRAFDFLLGSEGDIDRSMVLELHRLVVQDTLGPDLEAQVGVYRTVQVYIRGVEWMPPAPEDVPGDMRILFSWYTRNKGRLHPLIVAAYFHVGFETVHPFVDGNGRVGRLLMNHIMHRTGYPMINIPNTRKLEYYRCLEEGQDNGDLRPFIEFLLDLLRTSKLEF